MVWPQGPESVEDFSKLPNSVRSRLSGDTWQVPNVKAYFSNNYRGYVVSFYIEDYKNRTPFGINPLIINHPPEYAYTAIKDQTQSTYLEEITYPLRDSLFVNGLEPYDEETKEPRYQSAVPFVVGDEEFETKVILRYYPSPIWARFISWLGIVISFILVWKISKLILFEK